jgi:hypothetical protein
MFVANLATLRPLLRNFSNFRGSKTKSAVTPNELNNPLAFSPSYRSADKYFNANFELGDLDGDTDRKNRTSLSVQR